MIELPLQDFHRALSARFTEVNGMPAVDHYGDVLAEYTSLRASVGVIDLSFRGRACLTGNDRQRFLNGQVTNNVKDLQPGQGCYAAVVNNKGKMQGDFYIHALAEELLLDFEPGLTGAMAERLNKYIIADDVRWVDVNPHYGLLSVQGPQAVALLAAMGQSLNFTPPEKVLCSATLKDAQLGEICIVNLPRTGSTGFDFFAPINALGPLATRLIAEAGKLSGCMCGWQAFEIARIESGIPRYGLDMDETNLAPETGIESRAISYTKGCYTGQEVIARIRTYGQVAKSLRHLRLDDTLKTLPQKGDKLVHNGKEVGYITSAIKSPLAKGNLALGYVRREANKPGTTLTLRSGDLETVATVIELS
jgi:folate-binding protein YgfZ